LPPLPPTVHSYPEAVKECQDLMKAVGFKDLMDNAAKLKEEKANKEKQEEEG
jgi:hypothetical protein